MTDDYGSPQIAEFSEFYKRDMPRLVAFVMRLGADLGEACDVAQQAFVNAYPKWTAIRHHGAYLRTTASREFIRRTSNILRETPVAELPDSVSASGLSAEKVELRDEAVSVVQEISGLPARQREVMAWTLDGFTPMEIAVILGIPSGTVRGSLLKARRELKARLNIMQGGDNNA
jgi:RNA polymerase sigma factor (sigma-70 family)